MPDLELPDEIVERLRGLPYGPTGLAARNALERAINRALDAEGWPNGERGTIDIPTVHTFVNIWDRHGDLKGHVGPITNLTDAHKISASWRKAGYSAVPSRLAKGKALTNPHSS